MQSALLLAELCRHVTLIHRRAEFRCEPVLLDRLQKAQNVSIRTGGVINALLGEEKLSGLEVQFGEKKETLSADGLFVAIGQTPANGPFQTLVKLDQEGYILAGEDCKTSAEGVFAAGDCRQKQVRQLATAAGDGAVAGLAANAYLEASGS